MTNRDNLRGFLAELDRELTDLVGSEAIKAATAITLDAHGRIVERTPVDTGFAQNGWYVDVGELTERGPVNPGDGRGDTQGEILAKLASMPPFVPIYIASNVRYIRRLEDGSSTQAPQGMVAITFGEMAIKYAEIRTDEL